MKGEVSQESPANRKIGGKIGLLIAWQEIREKGFDPCRPFALAARPPVTAETDSKGGFDHLVNPTPGSSSDLLRAY